MTEASQQYLPVVAIVGRPNVGKSTLFNRLVGRRRSIVGDEPGITRDRIYGEAEWNGRRFRVIDTGGIVPGDAALIPSEIYRQARVALEEADATVFVVDVRTELTSTDIDLARQLLRGGKPLFLAVNKVDSPKLESEAENFRRLGMKEMYAISAEHSTGVAELLDGVLKALPEIPGAEGKIEAPDVSIEAPDVYPEELQSEAEIRTEANEAYDANRETRIAIIGRPNVGKSTLLNVLTGSDRAIVSPVAGTTRDAVDEAIERDGKRFRFVDTAGIRRKGKTHEMAEKLSVVMARKHLEESDIALLILDAAEGVTALDATIGGYAHESGRSVIIVVNKWDLVAGTGGGSPGRHGSGHGKGSGGKPSADPELYEQQVRNALKFLDYAPVVFVSATQGKNMDPLFAEIELVAREQRKRISTGEINRFLEKVDFDRATVPAGKRVKILYLTQAQVAPPTFILFTDRAVKLHFAYERFLQNQIRKAFGFVGTPIWIKNRARG